MVSQHSVGFPRTSLSISKECDFGSIEYLLNQRLDILCVELFIAGVVVVAIIKHEFMFIHVFGEIHFGLHLLQH